MQDFEALTPNLLARTIETVEGGGLVIILLRTMDSLKQLYTMTMVCLISYNKRKWGVLETLIFGRFCTSRCAFYLCNATKTSIRTCLRYHRIKQNEYTHGIRCTVRRIIRRHRLLRTHLSLEKILRTDPVDSHIWTYCHP